MNKFLPIAIVILLSAISQASVEYKWPVINGLAINNACATGTQFKSLKDITICTETAVVKRVACRYTGETETCRNVGLNEQPRIDETVTEATRCVKSQTRKLEVSRISTAMKCTKWSTDAAPECLNYETVQTTMGKVFNVETYSNLGSSEHGSSFVGYTKFEIPDCK
jgi:hypothetical protein